MFNNEYKYLKQRFLADTDLFTLTILVNGPDGRHATGGQLFKGVGGAHRVVTD